MFSVRIPVKRSLSFAILCMTCILLISGCTLPWRHRVVYVSAANIPKPTTQQLFSSLQKNFRAVSSFHVFLQVQNPGPAAPNKIQIHSADGDVVMPDKVKAQASVVLSGQSVTVNLISTGNNQYITDPITGQWRVIKGVLDPRTLTNPNTGLVSLIGKLQNVSDPVSDAVNNVPCWRVTGQLDAKNIAFFTGGGVPAGTMLQTNACIGKLDSLPYQVTVTGRAAAGDTAQTTYDFALSKYNENISINAPTI
ncbi:MAG: LppX_LprAFG lipoprotein [Verrucomicrobia bacterium]|nr:LppX_LprAFG lipoprotein [Verrucomicrobiota bacterium]